MQEIDKDPVPQGELALKVTALPRDCNSFGDIYGGWLVYRARHEHRLESPNHPAPSGVSP